MVVIFKDRTDAGRLLAEKLAGRIANNGVVLAIPRGGVVVGAELAKRLGFGNKMAGTPKDWLLKLAAPLINQGISLEELQKAPVRVPLAPKTPYCDKKFKTPSGKFEFICKFEHDKDVNDKYPLRLLSIMPKKWIGSEIPEDEYEAGILEVQVHPHILEAENIDDGDEALLVSPVGELKVKVIENNEVRKDSIVTYRGGWSKYNKCVNILTVDMISELGNGTPYYETMVKIKKI